LYHLESWRYRFKYEKRFADFELNWNARVGSDLHGGK